MDEIERLTKELADAEAALAEAEAEVAAIKAGVTSKASTAKPKLASQPKQQPKRHPKRVGDWRTSSRIPPEEDLVRVLEASIRMRDNETPVVTKHIDATRPALLRWRSNAKVRVRVFNDAGQQEGLAMIMTECESDKLEADLPLGWSLTSKRCK